ARSVPLKQLARQAARWRCVAPSELRPAVMHQESAFRLEGLTYGIASLEKAGPRGIICCPESPQTLEGGRDVETLDRADLCRLTRHNGSYRCSRSAPALRHEERRHGDRLGGSRVAGANSRTGIPAGRARSLRAGNRLRAPLSRWLS